MKKCVLLSVLAILGFLFAFNANAGIDEGLILHWSFDDCTMTDLTENGYDGTIHGDVTCTSGIKNSAITFSAESEAYATLTKTLDPNETKAFSFWINSIGFHDKDDYSIIISKYNWNGKRSFWLDAADNDNQISRISVVFYHNGTSYDGDCLNSYYPETPDDETVEVIINEPLEFGTWNHVVVNVLDTEIQMWINGKMVTRKERVYDSYYNSSEPTQVANEFLIGPDFNYKYYLNGSLDEFRVYNRVLLESEIQELYLEGETYELPENINTYLILTENSVPLYLPKGSYVQAYGSNGINTLNVEKYARLQCRNFIGENEINIEEASINFTAYRSGATVYLNSTSGTRVEIPATETSQTLRFADGSFVLKVDGNLVILGEQVVDQTEQPINCDVNSNDTSESIF